MEYRCPTVSGKIWWPPRRNLVCRCQLNPALILTRSSRQDKNDLTENCIFRYRTPRAAVEAYVSVISQQEVFVALQSNCREISKLSNSTCASRPVTIFVVHSARHRMRF